MERLAAIVGGSGLALGSAASLLMCGSSALTLEHRVVVFLVGLGLFVLGGSVYGEVRAHARAPRAEVRRSR